MLRHVSIDIETLGVKNDENPPVILTIGAVMFDPTKLDVVEYLNDPTKLGDIDVFYKKIDIDSCEAIGMVIEDETMAWWATQSEEAISDAFDETDRVPISEAIKDLNLFCRGAELYWSKDQEFDLQIIERAASRCNLGVVWPYNKKGAVRTIMQCAKFIDKTPTAHNALTDALVQTSIIQKCNLKLQAWTN